MKTSQSADKAGERTGADLLAARNSLFEIRNLEIDITARSAAVARTLAFDQAQIDAFTLLVEKLTQPSDRSALSTPELKQIIPLITGIDIVSESFSARRYVASFTIRFSPKNVSDFLAAFQIPHVLSAGPDIAIFDRYEEQEALSLWEEDALTDARSLVRTDNRIRQYHFVPSSFANRLAVSAPALSTDMNLVAQTLKEIAEKSAFLFLDVKKDPSGAYLYRYFLSETGHFNSGILRPTPEETKTESLARLYHTVLDAVDSLWRGQLLVDTDKGGVISITVVAHTIEDFSDSVSRLKAVPLISGYRIEEIAIPVSRFVVSYKGRLDQLGLALSYAGLNLSPQEEGFTILPRED